VAWLIAGASSHAAGRINKTGSRNTVLRLIFTPERRSLKRSSPPKKAAQEEVDIAEEVVAIAEAMI